MARHLSNRGINATAIHGNKSQNARTQALAEFKDGSKSVLVATDVASRGIDVDGVSHVFNFDLPNEVTYSNFIPIQTFSNFSQKIKATLEFLLS